jgi:hypothetical protein
VLPLLIAAVPPPPEAGGWDAAAKVLLGIAGWPVPRWMHPTLALGSEVLSVYADTQLLWPEYTAKRPCPEARDRAMGVDTAGRVVVLLGRETQRAFRDRVSEWLDFYEWGEGDAQAYGLLPYPSLWNRLWNYRENRRLGRSMLRRAQDWSDVTQEVTA